MAKKQTKQQRAQSNGVLRVGGGELEFEIRGRRIRADLIELKIALDEIEEKHGIADREYRPTGKFLRDVATYLNALGAERCTPTEAYQVWSAAIEKMLELKKNMSL